MVDAQAQNAPLPVDPVPAELLLAQGLQEQINVGKGQLNQLATATHLLGAQNAQTSIRKYSGEPKAFREWIKALEKHSMLVRSHNLGDTLKSLALQSAEGPVSDFLTRFYKNNETCS